MQIEDGKLQNESMAVLATLLKSAVVPIVLNRQSAIFNLQFPLPRF
ncbi:hypothetical protein NA78x_000762 [Anatilimnocola sp. NA78]